MWGFLQVCRGLLWSKLEPELGRKSLGMEIGGKSVRKVVLLGCGVILFSEVVRMAVIEFGWSESGVFYCSEVFCDVPWCCVYSVMYKSCYVGARMDTSVERLKS